MPIVATVQFFQTHRISETAALHWEDIHFDFEHPEESQIIVQRSIDWPREAPYSTELNWGFKNSIYLPGEKKVQSMYPEVFEALMKIDFFHDSLL